MDILKKTELVDIVGGKPITSSIKVAEAFEREHKSVLRSIQKLDCSSEFTERNFAPSEYTDSTGRKLKYYNITRDGFSFLVMGFTGPKAAKWKEQYINAFNAMEEKIREGVIAPQSLPEALRLAADEAEKRMQAEAELAAAQPKVAALDLLTNAEGTFCIREAAKILDMRPKDLTKWLSENKWIYKRVGSKRWVAYQDKIQSGYLYHIEGSYKDEDGYDKVSTYCHVTAKGMSKLAEILSPKLI